MNFNAYYSDPHFFHINIIRYCSRPCLDIDEMNAVLIERYNSKVSKSDKVLWLGDCFFKSTFETRKNITDQLNGSRCLLRGNHDKRITDDEFRELGFEEIYHDNFPGLIGKHKVRYSHYPYLGSDPGLDVRYMDRRPKREPHVTLIHGHTHENVKVTNSNNIHVGVDAWDLGPATYSEILELLDNKK